MATLALVATLATLVSGHTPVAEATPPVISLELEAVQVRSISAQTVNCTVPDERCTAELTEHNSLFCDGTGDMCMRDRKGRDCHVQIDSPATCQPPNAAARMRPSGVGRAGAGVLRDDERII